jgi:biopolymer transport protein ExbD
MRLTRLKVTHEKPELNIAAMVDVVFLLLIFFLVTSTFAQPEQQMPSRLPYTGPPTALADEPLDQVRIEVRATANPELVLLRCDGREVASFPRLLDELRARRAIDDFPVVIEGVGDVYFEFMALALDCCYQAGLHRVAYSAKGD